MKKLLSPRFLKTAAIGGLIAAQLAGCTGRIPLTKDLSGEIPPDYVPTQSYGTGISTCSLPLHVIYTDRSTGNPPQKFIMGNVNIACGGAGPQVVEVGVCLDKNIPRASARGWIYDAHGNVAGQRQSYQRPQRGHCPGGSFGEYVIYG